MLISHLELLFHKLGKITESKVLHTNRILKKLDCPQNEFLCKKLDGQNFSSWTVLKLVVPLVAIEFERT